MSESILLDGESLTIEQLVRVARNPAVQVEIDPATDKRVAAGEELIARVVDKYKQAFAAGELGATEYGVTTGFGEFKNKPIAPSELEALQRNLLLSHSVGVGENTDPDDLTNYFTAEVVRGALLTRLNAFLKGHSGVRRKLVSIVQRMLNCGVVPLVPLRGSVGASGDLCPLSHLFGVLLGEGRFYLAQKNNCGAPAGLHARSYDFHPASELPALLGFTAEELLPTFKEGLALVNGVNFSASMLALAVHDAEQLADTADLCAAMSVEALCGCTRAFDEKVHAARPHTGQITSAAHLRDLLAGSRLAERSAAVQDAYSLRCAPQVHGATRDAIAYARAVAERELNAATDNPLFFPDGGPGFDLEFRANWPAKYAGEQRLAYSAGNFHGQPLALAADFLGIAAAELANISERRTQALLDEDENRGLPSNLTTKPGVNSGLMIAQYTAASIVSENKVLAHPASVDSIPTGANTEDHVSMSTIAARKLRTIVSNVQAVLAIEMLVASQAIEWRVAMIGGLTEAHTLDEAERQATGFREAIDGRAESVAEWLGGGTRNAYLRVRSVVQPVFKDRPLHDDVRRVRETFFD